MKDLAKPSWTEVRLGDLIELISGQHIAAKDYNAVGRGLPYLTGPSDFGSLNPQISKWTEHPKKKAIEGDILITVKGSGVGSINVLNIPEAVISRQIMAIRPEKIDRRFLYLHLEGLFDHFQEAASGAAIPGLSREDVSELRLHLPPLKEQRRIVAILDEAFEGLNRARENAEVNLQNARELFESFLEGTFNEAGSNSQKCKLADLIKIGHGFAFKSRDFEVSLDPSRPILLTPGNYGEDARLKFTEKNTKRLRSEPPKDFVFQEGELTVVMTDLSSKMKILGKPAFIDRANILHNQRIGRIEFKSDALLPRWLFYFLRTQQALVPIKSTSTGTMVRHTAPKRILSLHIPLPSDLDEQQNAIDRLDALEAEANRLQSEYKENIEDLADLRRALLQKAFSGELR